MSLLVAKDSSNPVLLKLVLQGIASDWQIDQELLTRKIEVTSRPGHGTFTENTEGPDLLRETGTKHEQQCGETTWSSNPSPDVQAHPLSTPSPTPDLFPVSPGSLGSCGGICRSTSPRGTPDLQNPASAVSASWPSQKPARISIRQVAKLAAGM